MQSFTNVASLLLAVSSLTKAQSSSASNSSSCIGPECAPYPNTNYPGYADPAAQAGAQSFQKSPPSYPSPWMNGAGDWAEAYKKAQAFVSQLTLAEKVNLTTGTGWESNGCVGSTGSVPRLGFRSLCLQDSPIGLRDTDYNSVFPGGVTIAATWDRGLFFQRGYDMGMEHRGKGSDMQLGPVVGPIGRVPAGGRGWEGFSPDPVLSGIAVAQTVKGTQSAGVMACTKHLVGNEQEHFRQVGEAAGYGFNISEVYSSNIDDTTMHELYLWPFADAVRAGTAGVMCVYNQVNNSYGCQNSYLLNHLLKNELGFQGFVVSDWQAQHAGVETAFAGLDLAMPGDTIFDTGASYWGTNMTIAVLNGTMPEWRLDDMAMRVMTGYYLVGRDHTSVPVNFASWTTDTYGYQHFYASENYGIINEHVDVRGEHAADIRVQAAMGTVLLKNTDGALPLTHKEKFTAVFGEDAAESAYGPNGCSDRGCDNGTLACAWGSGSSNFPYLITPLTAISNEVHTMGNGIIQSVTDNYALDKVQALAPQAAVSIVFVNSDSGEGFISVDGNEGDRNNLTLWGNGDTLIQNVTANCNNTIVVIHSTGPVLVNAWNENPNVTAILWAGLPGEQSGNSIADVLYGRVNPGGKLPFTMGSSREEWGTDILYKPNNGNDAPQINFEEGVFIDYRAFDKHNITPVYEFGFGMSYTTFSYSDLVVESKGNTTYTASTGMTEAAPSFGAAVGSASDYVFPTNNITRIPYYIYPYLNSTNLKESSGATDYGMPSDSYLPPNVADGNAQPILAAGGGPGGNPHLYDVMYTVSATIMNTGKVPGDEVPQLYLSLGGPDDPKVVLRGFERLSIQPGMKATFTADLTRRDLSNWDTNQQNWVVTSCPKTVYVGSSSRKLILSAPLSMGSSTAPSSSSTMPASSSVAMSSASPSAYSSVMTHGGPPVYTSA